VNEEAATWKALNSAEVGNCDWMGCAIENQELSVEHWELGNL
jgi:hypothetical protein